MFYWVIPYLVAYNLSDTATNWKNGPVHTFEAEANLKIIDDSGSVFHTDTWMLFDCKSLNTSFVKCQIQNFNQEEYEMKDNNKIFAKSEKFDWYEEFRAIDFYIEFDKMGVKNIKFVEEQEYYCEMMIQSIFNNLNVGIDLTDKNFEHYVAVDKTVYGDCPTNFDIKKLAKRDEDKEVWVKRDVAVGKLMIVPFFDKFIDHQTILIEKDRKMIKCLNKRNYVFGIDEVTAAERKRGYITDLEKFHSRSQIYLGTNHFNSFSEHSGTFKVGYKSENMLRRGNRMMTGKTSEKIRLTLVSILEDTAQ